MTAYIARKRRATPPAFLEATLPAVRDELAALPVLQEKASAVAVSTVTITGLESNKHKTRTESSPTPSAAADNSKGEGGNGRDCCVVVGRVATTQKIISFIVETQQNEKGESDKSRPRTVQSKMKEA